MVFFSLRDVENHEAPGESIAAQSIAAPTVLVGTSEQRNVAHIGNEAYMARNLWTSTISQDKVRESM